MHTDASVTKDQTGWRSSRMSLSMSDNSLTQNRKPQALLVHTDGSVTKDQTGWDFTVKQGVTTIHEDIHADNGGGSSHPCPSLDSLKSWQSCHTCHHSHRRNELAIRSEKCNAKPRLEFVDGRHPPSKTPVGVVLPWTYRSDGKWPTR